MTYARQPAERRRWEIRLLPGDPDCSMIWPFLSRWITPDDAEIERAATYTFHSLVAERWRRGAPDPYIHGQGVCADIRDVSNLAWKFAAAVRGRADEALLDSYQSEQMPNVTRYITTAVGLGSPINASDPSAALQLAYVSDGGVARMKSLVSTLGPGLGIGAHNGELFGQPTLGDGQRCGGASSATRNAGACGHARRPAPDTTVPPSVRDPLVRLPRIGPRRHSRAG